MFSIFPTIDRMFFLRTARRLRNKPGGMAWIKHDPQASLGEEQLCGRAVRCVRLCRGGRWEIDPPQSFVVTRSGFLVEIASNVRRGDRLTVWGIDDDLLEPWQEIGDVRDEALFAAPPTTKELHDA